MSELVLKSINELLGEHFYIPYYQRGYRWTKQQVNDLLNDVWAFANKSKAKDVEFYCLQPIVVKERQWDENEQALTGWEVIDGQQRLTTIYIIISYLAKEFLKVESLVEDYGRESYTLRYETRTKSEEFLKNIVEDKSNIDFYHISEAYKTVKEWFTSGVNTKDRTDKNRFLDTLLGKKEDERSVQIIWYKVGQEANSVELFIRLNIGKIPLTNAELIKALFLSSTSFAKDLPEDALRKKLEISQMWDEMEQRLGDEQFWSFVTNAKQSDFPTKIELLFDMIARKVKDEKDSLFTFLYFLSKSKDNPESLWGLWLSIEQYYLTICEWHKDKNLYHKVGYLVTSGEQVSNLITHSMKANKKEFEEDLDIKIRNSLNFDIEELSYDNKGHYNKIENLLLLFNTESIRSNQSISEFYPFKFHKQIQWSLEHIHAQNSESLDKTKKEQWLTWLSHHRALITELLEDGHSLRNREQLENLLEKIVSINADKLTWDNFNALATEIIREFSENSEGYSDDLHSVSNLALLSHANNAALNNAVFEVKRREIIKMDKEGSYIPICTRRVFLKYYNDKPSVQQYYFWGKEDRENYLNEIKTVELF